MSRRISQIHRVIATIAIQVQAVDGIGIQIGGIIGGDEAAPFGAVISGVAVVQTGIFVIVIAAVTDGVGFCYGSVAGNSAVTL